MSKERLMKIILAPVISEKSSMAADASDHYTFKVAPDATKPEISAAVEMLFDVKVEKIQTVSVCHSSVCPVNSVKAGMGATSPAEAADAAAEQAVWLILFSRIFQGRPDLPTIAFKAAQHPYPSSTADRDMGKTDPIFNPT